MSYKVLGLNSGLGVSLYPFKNQLIGNFETRGVFHTIKNEQWKLNFENIPLIKTFQPDLFFPSEFEVIISSPDCGSGSIFRLSRAKEYGNHKKNLSLLEFFNGINYYKPKLFLFENLEGLFKSLTKKDFKERLSEYNLIIHNSPVSAWGNSQKTRKRLIVVGVRKDLNFQRIKKYFKLPHYEDRIKTCGELYSDLRTQKDFNGNVREPMSDVISIHARKRMSIKEIFSEWNNRLAFKKRWTVQGGNFSTAPGVYRNLIGDYPATARRANRQFDETGRMLTPRQLARIQGVPDEFQIYIDKNKLNYWINKARTTITKTPPFEIGSWFKRKLDKSYHIWQ